MSDTKHPADVLADRMDQATAHGSLYYLDVPARIAIAEQLRRIPALEAELEKLKGSAEFRSERQAQREHRLWQWAHEELSEPLKTRYFNIVANGTADVMEQPVYAQHFNMMKHRAESAESERDALRAQLGLPEGQGVVVARDGAAPGLKKHDVLLEVDGKPVGSGKPGPVTLKLVAEYRKEIEALVRA